MQKAISWILYFAGNRLPKVFIRQKVNITTKKTTREVVDGQQRLRTVLSFIKGHLEKCPDEPEPGQRTSPGLGILAFGRS